MLLCKDLTAQAIQDSTSLYVLAGYDCKNEMTAFVLFSEEQALELQALAWPGVPHRLILVCYHAENDLALSGVDRDVIKRLNDTAPISLHGVVTVHGTDYRFRLV